MPLNHRSKGAALLDGWRMDLALHNGRAWPSDPHFALALLAGLLFFLLWPWFTESNAVVPVHSLLALAMLVLLQPLVEELLFRGLLQGKLLALAWGKHQLGGFTLANLATSALFTALHFINHSPLWALGVLLPSLLFGYFRDRHDSIYPAIALHIFYNAGYFLLPLINFRLI